MYREPGERPAEPNENASKPTERVEVSRTPGLTPVLGVTCVVCVCMVYVFTGRGLAAGLSLIVWLVFVNLLVRLFLRPAIVEIDFAERRLRSGRHDRSFDELSHAKVLERDNATELGVSTREGEELWLTKGVRESVNAAADEINLALSAEYDSIRLMPDGLAYAMKRLTRGFPLADFGSIDSKSQHDRIVALLQTLPLTSLQVKELPDGMLQASGLSRGMLITFLYSRRKDRAEMAAVVKSPHGNIELVGRDGMFKVANGWMESSETTPDLLVNGDTNRRAFASMTKPLREHIVGEVQRLRLRGVNIYPEETRVVSRDGLRDLRDPRARLAGMLQLVVEIGEGLTR